MFINKIRNGLQLYNNFVIANKINPKFLVQKFFFIM